MQKVTFSIGLKLVIIITMLVLISLGAVTYIVSYFVGDDTKRTAEENNHTLTSVLPHLPRQSLPPSVPIVFSY